MQVSKSRWIHVPKWPINKYFPPQPQTKGTAPLLPFGHSSSSLSCPFHESQGLHNKHLLCSLLVSDCSKIQNVKSSKIWYLCNDPHDQKTESSSRIRSSEEIISFFLILMKTACNYIPGTPTIYLVRHHLIFFSWGGTICLRNWGRH